MENDDKYLQEQLEAFHYWSKKREAESTNALAHHDPDADFVLALQIQAEEEEAAGRTTQIDNELARRMQEQERKVYEEHQKIVEQDALIAQALYEEEQREIEERKNSELVRMMLEKEELEKQLTKEPNQSPNLALVEYPEDWVSQTGSHQMWDVPRDSSEWNRIQSHFNRTLGSNITKIQRNQNKDLWMWYWLKKQEICRKNGSNSINENFLFHGSRSNAYDVILKNGFDHRVANMGGAIGGINSYPRSMLSASDR
eukprot:TRINITY_DN4982_c0_g1_i5.p1 TRINITY_DN4982_c0_g1~~TRINITY_DN4982_c0_g1_i5.p1  ORF type:complete len:297 (-),score=54.74 TRINITY_DN4982_c0_g1_i5:337-1104(-)